MIILVIKNGTVCMCKYVINVCNKKCILEKNTYDCDINNVISAK